MLHGTATSTPRANSKSVAQQQQLKSPSTITKSRRPHARTTQIDLRKDLVGRIARTVLQVDKSAQTDVSMHLFRLGVEMSTRVIEAPSDEDFGDEPPPFPSL